MGRVSTVDERPFGTAAARHADGDRLFWAAVLAWTPVANLYAGAYDAVLAVPAALLVAGELRRRRGRLSTAYIATVAAVWLTPWFTSLAARATGVQLLTIAMAALGTFTVRPGRRTLVGGDWPARRPATSPFQVWPVQLAPSARWIDGPPENPVRG